jgi:hypothetical protein
MEGGAAPPVDGRFIWGGGAETGRSWLERENGKPAEGVIFSHPWRAEPVKFVILCMLWGMW